MANADITNPQAVTSANIVYSARVVEALKLTLPRLDGFCTNFTDEFAEPGDTVNAPYVAPGTVSASFTSYLTGTLDKKSVAVQLDNDVYVGYPVTEKDLMYFTPGHWEKRADADAYAVAQKILTDASAVATGAKVTQSAVIGAATAFTLDTIASIRSTCVSKGIPPEQATLYLAPAYFTKALTLLTYSIVGTGDILTTGAINGLFGFKAVVEVPGLTAAAGFVAAPTAVVIASRAVPAVAQGIFLDRRYITDETSGLTLTLTTAGDVSDGKVVTSIRCHKGEVLADPKAIVKLIEKA